MTTKKVDVKSGRLFPWQFQLLGVIIFITAIATFQSYLILGFILLIVSLLIFTSYSGIEFNASDKTYKPYHSLLFLKYGKSRSYDEVERIYINSSNTTQRIYTAHTNNSMLSKSKSYDAYVLFLDGSKEFLLSRKNKKEVIEQLGELSNAVHVEVYDNTMESV